jgi:hypothetical protein
MVESLVVTSSQTHRSLIVDQFGRQAELFAGSSELHSEAALSVLVDAAQPTADNVVLAGGTVVAAFARRVRQAVGLDATDAMLRQAQKRSVERSVPNTA